MRESSFGSLARGESLYFGSVLLGGGAFMREHMGALLTGNVDACFMGGFAGACLWSM
ncbi:hypothetical protein [Bartonella heixiaziensis]|uniref:hypothetical protein n=1 Tax=Bartonella heixiaziensis TaxID=1461000 RepID=UPI003D230CE8